MGSYSDNLIQKTKRALSSIDEASVVYSLVSLYKAVEDRGNEKSFPTLNLYRDWVVHTDLDRNKRLGDFFKQWDDIIDGIAANSDKLEATNLASDALVFDHLFNEIESLGVALETRQKYLFINALMTDVIDAPLRWKGKNVKEFRFTFEQQRKDADSTYFCHMQIQLVQGLWFDGPELHF